MICPIVLANSRNDVNKVINRTALTIVEELFKSSRVWLVEWSSISFASLARFDPYLMEALCYVSVVDPVLATFSRVFRGVK